MREKLEEPLPDLHSECSLHCSPKKQGSIKELPEDLKIFLFNFYSIAN
jgi:hypothetical protein